ncbi:MAG: AbrB/MazE/SpoVT family DNA-binding domain-containing protein [Bacillota bacterium]
MKFYQELPFKTKITKPGKVYLPRKIREFINAKEGQNVTLFVGEDKKSILLKLND